MATTNGKKPANQAAGVSGRSGTAPPEQFRFKPGQSGNPAGRPPAGASVREWWNQMQEWSTEKIEAVAADPSAPAAKRAAAQQWLKAVNGADASCDRIIDYTEGRPTQNVKLNGEMAHRHEHDVRPVMDKLRGDPSAYADAKRLADRLRDANAVRN